MSTIFKVGSNRKWTCCRFKTALNDTVIHTDALCQISESWPLWFPKKMWQKLSCEQICLCPQYLKSRQTGSGHAADSKLRYPIQFSILMLCAKYQKAGLCGSREKCDRNYLVSISESCTLRFPRKMWQKFFCDADADDDARRRIVIPICRLR